MENQIKPGDVVRLKSDGLQMTVKEVAGPRIMVIFFDKNHELREVAFNENILVKG